MSTIFDTRMTRHDRRPDKRGSFLCQTPLGPVAVDGSQRGVASLRFCERLDEATDNHCGWAEQAKRWIDTYFSGTEPTFAPPLDLRGTPFQIEVWHAAMRVPYGTTESYGSLAAAIGRPGAARAVASALAANPVALIVPCHRVVATNGPGGYAYGLHRKLRLLALESGTAQREQ